MKRDWDIIRELLSRVEECTLPNQKVLLSDFTKERAPEVSYHMALLIDAGLVSGHMSNSISGKVKDFIAQKLTWSGHEFLDSIRSDTVWQRIKAAFKEKGLDMTFDLVKEVAKKIVTVLL